MPTIPTVPLPRPPDASSPPPRKSSKVLNAIKSKENNSSGALWKKAFRTVRALNRFKLTAVSCATCTVEEIMQLFDIKEEKRGALVGGHYLNSFCTELQHMVPDFLEGVSMEVFEQIALCLKFRQYESGSTLMSVGDKPDGWYFIVAGSCAVFANDEDANATEGHNKRLGVIKAGVGFGELGFLTADAVRNATITATAPHGVYTLFVPKEDYVTHLIRFNKKNDTIVDTQQFLAKAQMLSWLDDRASIQLAHGVIVRDIDPFEVYKHQGEVLDEVFIVRSGFIKLIQRVGTLSVTLAILGPGDMGGITDLIISLASKKNDAVCRCSYRTEGQSAKLLVIRRYGFEQTVLSTLRPLVEDVVKVRLIWEAMRVRHKQKHPGTHMAISKNMMETYGYTNGPATEMVQKRRRTPQEDEARKRFYHVGKQARQLTRSVGVGPETAMQNDASEKPKIVQAFTSVLNSSSKSMEKEHQHLDVAGRLKLANQLYNEAVQHAKIARLHREASIAALLAEQCLQAMVFETFKTLRLKARQLSQKARVKVAAVMRTIDPDANANERKNLKLKKIKLAKECDHKVMVAFSTWMRTAKQLEEYLKMGLDVNSTDMQNQANKNIPECKREMKKLKRLMASLTNKKQELTNAPVPRRRSVVKTSQQESDSSDDDMSMYITTREDEEVDIEQLFLNSSRTTYSSMNDTAGFDLQLRGTGSSTPTRSFSEGVRGTSSAGVAGLQWNLQGIAVPLRSESKKQQKKIRFGHPRRPKHPQRSPQQRRLFSKSVVAGQTQTSPNKQRRLADSSVTILPRPMPKHLVNMHAMVCDSTQSSGKLIKFLLEHEARRTLNFSCVVDIVTGLFKRGEEDAMLVQQQNKYGTRPSFTFVVLDLGNVFAPVDGTVSKMTALSFKKLPKARQQAWIQRLYRQKATMVQELKQHFQPDTSVFVTVGEPGWEHLLKEMCVRGVAQGMIPKPYNAVGVRRMLKEHYKVCKS